MLLWVAVALQLDLVRSKKKERETLPIKHTHMTTTTTFSSSFAVKLVGITAAAICMMFLILRSSGEKGEKREERVVEESSPLSKTTFKIIYASQNGTAFKMAQELANLLANSSVLVLGIKDYEWEDLAMETAVVVGSEGNP
jgi:sulfite reductase alpha subunit-like flavoprotein